MLNSDQLAQKIIGPKRITKSQFSPISYLEATRLNRAAMADAKGIAQVALAAFCEGIAGAANRRFCWATVKLYYSAFQSLRARLLLAEQIVFYQARSPYSIRAVAGETAQRRSGNSHMAIFTVFGQQFPSNDLFVQTIDGVKPLVWLERKRNESNYGLAPNPDPKEPEEYRIFGKNPRLAVTEFMNDASLAFDADKAIVALPMKLLIELSVLLASKFDERIIEIDKHFVDVLASEKLLVPGFFEKLRCFDAAT